MKSWQKILGIVLVIVAVGALAVNHFSKGDGTSTKTKDGKTKITMAWWGAQTRHDATVKVIKMYEKLHPKIDIDYEFYDFDGYFTKMNTLQASKTVWDVFQMGNNYQTYLSSIQPLNKYIKDGTIDVSDTSEQYLKTTKYNKDQLGISNGAGAYAIAYDPSIFKKAGIPEPTSDWTWDEFEDIALKIHKKLGIYGFSNFDDFIAGATVGVGQYGKGQEFFDKASDSKKLGFKNAKLLVPYLEMRKKLVDAGAYPDTGAIAEIKDIEGDYLVTGKAAMTWIAANQITSVTNASKRQIKMVTLPKREKDVPAVSVSSAQMMCIAKNSKVKKEAAKFISWFENDLKANKILNAERGVPIMTKVRNELSTKADPTTKQLIDYVDLVGEIGNKNANNVESPYNNEIKDHYILLLQQVVAGEMKPDKAATELYKFAKEKTQE
ncbi:MAG: extracellular solute-binding protein [Lactobacillaceae bacterium]|jgi:multiple sugar transport system substrate-binding protein|nr:extracellular solute-binding protein [Lactobacillaceae bacterium]